MNRLIFFFLIILSAQCFASTPIREVRLLYQTAINEEKSCKALLVFLSPYTEQNSPLLLGYKASATMLMAKYAINPFNKLSYFNEGKKMLERAIQMDENNVELRFLRFAVQNNAPSFLGYRNQITGDKAFLLKSVSELTDSGLKKLIISYLKTSHHLNDVEKQKLES